MNLVFHISEIEAMFIVLKLRRIDKGSHLVGVNFLSLDVILGKVPEVRAIRSVNYPKCLQSRPPNPRIYIYNTTFPINPKQR